MNIRKFSVGGMGVLLGLLLSTFVFAATAPGAPVVSGTISGYASSTTQLSVSVSYASSGAVAGDVLNIYSNGSTTPLSSHLITTPELNSASTTLFNIAATALGSDGSRTISADFNGLATSTASSAIILDTVTPTFSAVSILSNNASTTIAKIGDQVGVTFTTNETVQTPLVNILSHGAISATNISGNTWAATTTVLSGDTNASLATFSIAVSDLAGNPATRTTVTDTSAVTLDTVLPTLSAVSIASNNAVTTLAKAGNVVTLSFTSSEKIQTPTVTILGHVATVLGSLTSWTASTTVLTGDTNGAATFTINFSDIAGNAGVQVTALNPVTPIVTVDTVAPVLVFTKPLATAFVKGASLIAFTDSEQTALSCGIIGQATTSACTSNVTTVADLPNFAGVSDGAISLVLYDTDSAGNAASTTIAVTKDTSAPGAPLPPTAAAGPLINAAEQTSGVTVIAPLGTSNAIAGDSIELLLGGSSFPTPVTKILNATDITNGSTTLSIVSGQFGADGAKSLTTRVTDQAGNLGAASPTLALTLDTVAPTAALTYSISHAVKSGNSLTITATFSEAITGTAQLSIAGAGQTLASTTMTTSSPTATYVHTVLAGNGTATVLLGAVTDLAGNPLVATPTSGGTFTVDNVAPTLSPVSIASNNASTTLAKIGNVVTVTFTSNEALGFISATIGTHTATIATTTPGTGFTAIATLDASDATGVVTFSITPTDLAGNVGSAVTTITTGSSVVFDKTAPTLTLDVAIVTPANDSTPDLQFHSSESGLVSYSGGCTAGTGSVTGGQVTTVTLNSLADGTYNACTLSVIDAAGNLSSALAIPSFTIDTVAPTITSVTSALADGYYKLGQVIPLTVNFSENATSSLGVTLTTSVGSSCTTAGFSSAASASCNVTVTAGQNSADLDVTAISGVIKDLAGNLLTSFTPATTLASARSIVVDTTAPTLTIVAIASNNASTTLAKAGNTVNLAVVAGEALGGINGTVLTHTATVATSSATQFSLSTVVLGADVQGSAAFSISYTDLAGNSGFVTSTTTNSSAVYLDTVAPSSTYAPTVSAGPLINAAEQTAGVSVVINLNPATTSPAVAGDTVELLLGGAPFGTPITKVLTATDIANASTSVTIASGQLGTQGAKLLTARVTDLAGNVGTLSGTTSLTLDTIAPVAPTFTSAAGDNKVNAAEFSHIIILGTTEANASVLLSLTDSLSVTKSTTTTASAAGAISDYINGSTATAFTDGALTLNLTATDQAGNVGPATTVALLLDSTPPTTPVVSFPAPGYINRAASTTVPVSIIGEGNTSANYILSNGGLATSSATANLVTTGVAIIPTANSSTLPDGTVTVSVALTDAVGNVSATTTSTILKDTVLPVFSSVTPANNAYINNVTTNSAIAFTNSKVLTSGSVVLTRTGGATDGTVHTCNLVGTSLNTGAHTLNLSDTVNSCAVAQTLVDGSIYSIAFNGADSFANPAATVTKTNVTYDVTPPVVTISVPVSGITIATTTPLNGTTNETATCTYSLDGVNALALTTTGATTQATVLNGVSTGAHSALFVCTDLANNTATSSARAFNALATSGSSVVGGSSPIVFGGTATGQINLPASIISLDLNSLSPLYASTSLSTVSGGNLVLGGVSTLLNGGIVAGVNLNLAQTVGDQTLTVGTGYKLVSGTSGTTIVFSNSSMPGSTLTLSDGTVVMGSATWDGNFFGPISGSASGSAPAGFTVGDTIAFGSNSSIILLSKPATILLTTTKPVVMKVTGSSNWLTPATCTGTFALPTSPTAFSECMITSSTQVKIVTFHLTTFGTLTAIPPTPPVIPVGNGPIAGSFGGGSVGGGGNGPIVVSSNTNPTTTVTAPKISLIIPPASAQANLAFRNTQIAKIYLQIASLRKEYTLALAREKAQLKPSSNLAKVPAKKPATNIAKVKPKVELPVANLGSLLNNVKATSVKATTTTKKKSTGFWSWFGF